MTFIEQYKGLDRQIYLLAVVRCVNSMGQMFVFPFTSLLLTQVLGFTAVQAGYFMLLTSVVNALSNAVGGKLSDRMSRRKIIFTAYLGVIAIMVATSFVCRTLLVLPALIAAHIFVCIALPSISALVLDKCDYYRRRVSLSLLYLASNIGSALGPILAGLLFYRHMSLSFLCMAFGFTITASVVFFLITDKVNEASRLTPPDENDAPEVPAAEGDNYIKMIFRNKILLVFVLTLGLTSLCYSSISYMLPLHFTEMAGLEAGSRYYSMIWTVNGAIVVFFTPILISWTRKRSQLTNAAAACLLYALGFGVYAFTHSLPLYYMAVLIWTSGEILLSTGGAVFIAAQSPPTHKGRAMATYEFARSVGRSMGPLCFGYIIDGAGYGATWRVIAATCFLLFLVMAAVTRYAKRTGRA